MRLSILMTLGAAVVGPMRAQEVTGNVHGRVLGPTREPAAGVRVTVIGPHLLGTRVALSDRDGFFEVRALPPGDYAVQLSRIGFRPMTFERVAVEIGHTTTIGAVTLEWLATELEPLVVVAPRGRVDPVQTTVGANLDARDYAALPAERDYKSIIAILPHVNESHRGDAANAGGSTGLENAYFIDGVNVTSTKTASTGTNLPYNFVRAVEVRVGGYEAQFGKAMGAIVNAVTYSGGNDFEAEAFGFFNHAGLSFKPKAQPTLQEQGAIGHDAGVRLSGPVVRGRLWYSAAYNPQSRRVDKQILGHGSFEDRKTTHSFAGKITWQATPELNLALSVFGDPAVHYRVEPTDVQATVGFDILNPDSYLSRLSSGGTVASLRTTAVLRDWAVVEVNAARAARRNVLEAATALGLPIYVDRVSRSVSGGFQWFKDESESRSSVAIRGTVTRGPHTVVAGAEYEDAAVSRLLRRFVIERLVTGSFRTDSASQTSGGVHNRVPTAYLQDAWRVTGRLTLNAGVRWSEQHLVGESGRTAQRLRDEWQPRVGFTWQLGDLGTQRVFGSYGRFYQTEPLNLASIFYAGRAAKLAFFSEDPRLPGAQPTRVQDNSRVEADFAKQVDGVRAEHFDEFTLGYEHVLGSAAKLTLRGIRRDLRSSFVWGMDVDTSGRTFFVIGTPGKGDLAYLPPPKREYTALEIGAAGAWWKFTYRLWYVLSRAWGNYPGLFYSDLGFENPGGNGAFFMPHQATNSTGLLPNDRTHVFKLSAAYRPAERFSVGSFFTWQTGSPLNEFGLSPLNSALQPAFLVPRGSVGRTPDIRDLNLRFTYDVPWSRRIQSRLLVDLLHVGNEREVVRVNEFHLQALEDPDYLRPVAFQPPMFARLGVEVRF